MAIDVDADCQVRGLVLHRAGVADLAHDRVQEDQRVDPVEGVSVRVLHLLEHRVSDLEDEIRGDLDLVDLGEVGLDAARRHAR